ncbi:hypothetical protein [Bradyrhizobium sp. USDA 10063]
MAGIVLHDDVVVETAPIVRFMRRWSRDRVREYCRKYGWDISVVSRQERAPIAQDAIAPVIVQHEESFEVVRADGSIEFIYFDENASRRAINGRLSKQAAFAGAQQLLHGRNP